MNWTLQLVFFLSRATGLVYEVVWGRMLATVLGSTVEAASIVMGVFMAGLALGARLFGSWGDKTSSPLRMYALLEAGIGISAFGVSTTLPHLHHWYPNIVQSPGMLEALVLKIGIAVAFLLVPTMLMGGTLPVLSRYVVRKPQNMGNPVGTLYGLNTLGALVGCIFSGFFGIETLGLLETTNLASVINVGIFLCCFFLLSERPSPSDPCDKSPLTVENKTQAHSFKHREGFLWAYALSGATGLAYEVLWIRLLSTTFIGTSYGFAAMLATCLGGMALGSLSFRKKADETPHALAWFAAMQMGIACWGQLMLLPYKAFPAFQSAMAHHLGISWGNQLLEMLSFSGALILVPAFLLGAMFPLANRIWGGGRRGVGKNVGSLYTANTLGCVAGSITAGILLLPHLGIQNALVVLGVLNCAIALYAVSLSTFSIQWKRRFLAIAVGSMVLLVLLVPGNLTTRTAANRLKAPWGLLYYYEGLDNNTMILENEQTHVRRLMTTFFQYIGDTSAIMLRIQKLQAHLPILLRGSPKEILFVGMGTGITPATATAYPADIICCEISRGVIKASRFFSSYNKEILHNPQIKLIQEDGRHYLLQADRSFDLIVGDLYNAALAGMGNLYSREYYALCRSRLREKGMMCQWISMKDLPEEELKGVMATFGQVFPHTALWCATPDILAMVGTLTPLQADMASLEKAMETPGLRNELREIGLDNPFFLLSHFLMNQKAWNAYTQGSQIVTDDKPYMEYSIPRSLHYLRYKEDMPATLRNVNAGKTVLISPKKKTLNDFEKKLDRISRSESHLFKGYAFFLESRLTLARNEFQKALSLNPWNMDAELFMGALEQQTRAK